MGALMLSEDALDAAIEQLQEEYFYKPENQKIFNAIRTLFSQNYKVDMLTVVDKLRSMGELEAAGGAYYVSSLTNNVVSAAHIEYHAKILAQKSVQRELIRVSTETLTDAYDETQDVMNLLDRTEGRLMEINDRSFRHDISSIDSLVSMARTQIDEAQQSDNSLSGLPTGFTELDRHTGGFQKGTLIILAARPAMGKTAFALSMARNMAVDFKKPVAIFSLEMTGVELAMRLISAETDIPAEKLKKGGMMSPADMQQLETRSQALNEAKIFIDDTPGLTIFDLRAKCRRLRQRQKIEMVFIDYLQLMSGGGDQRNGNREQEISSISRQLKGLSKELGIPILAMAQLSRAVETRPGTHKPLLSDLRESGAIEQDADIVMFIYRPEYYGLDVDEEQRSTKGVANIILAKHRAGSTGEVRLRFRHECVRFENLEYVPAGQFASDIPVNEQFDGGQSPTITLDSKMNWSGDEDVPF